jgi:glutaredoxin 3
LNQKGVQFEDTDVLSNPDEKPAMIKRADGARTVPQIFIGDIHVGGCDELFSLERAGHLDGMLAA